jgi:hypothetical protein
MFAVEDLMKLGFTRRQVETIALELGYARSAEYPEDVHEALLTKKNQKKTKPEQAMDDAAQEHAASMGIDLQDVDEGAQRRAAAMTVGRDALTLYYLASQQFTVPGLSDTVDASRNRLKDALRGEFYEPEAFLSQRAIGTSGSPQSLTGKTETLPPSADSTDAELSPTSDSAA